MLASSPGISQRKKQLWQKSVDENIVLYTGIDTEIEVNRAQSQMTNGTFPCRLPRRSTGDQISQRTLGKARKKITDTRRHLIE